MGTATYYGLYSDSPGYCNDFVENIYPGDYQESEFSKEVIKQSKTPGWKKCMSQGAILPVNPYEVVYSTISRRGLSGTGIAKGDPCPVREKWVYEDYFDPLNYPDEAPPAWLEEAKGIVGPGDIQDAVNSAIADSSAGRMQLAVTAGEARETYKLLVGTLGRLVHVTRLIAGTAKSKKIDFDSAWLEMRYAWRPLYYEVVGYIEHWNDILYKGQRSHGSGKRTVTMSTKTDTIEADYGVYIVSDSLRMTAKSSLRGFALSEVEDPVKAKYGLNPVTTAWELTKLSFMVDWIWDFGSFLAAQTVGLSGYSLKASGVSIKTEIEYECMRSLSFSDTYGWSGSATGQRTMRKITQFSRVPVSGGSIPSIDLHLKPLQMVDMALIVKQIFAVRF